ncbi:hypothetical protein [Rhodopirellula halodulae]|uniref:hypothetical protein n=1 Tax=Rhodopirellula halodulae TaxID=2894198 RepID=UPI001E5F2E98|nr:hypothetical protein [Rhodopirellula sp. JC737]MCC9655597.1 hypothetical protein [Rhodopirellula sp. JC737]
MLNFFKSKEDIAYEKRKCEAVENVPIVREFAEEVSDEMSEILDRWVRPGRVSAFGPWVRTECFDQDGNRYCALGVVNQDNVYSFNIYDIPPELETQKYRFRGGDWKPIGCDQIGGDLFIVLHCLDV